MYASFEARYLQAPAPPQDVRVKLVVLHVGSESRHYAAEADGIV